MAVAHIILHGYGTWHPDHEKGWHQHGVAGRLPPAPNLAVHRRTIQNHTSVEFSPAIQFQLVDMAWDVCVRRNWRCHAAAANNTHVHIVASWRDALTSQFVQDTLKRLLGMRVAQVLNKPGHKWFSRGGKPRAVKDKAHLNYLLEEYLPGQAGVLWREGTPGPQMPGEC